MARKPTSGKSGPKKAGRTSRTKERVRLELQEWSDTGLLDHFKQAHDHREDRAFCFILGAGASKPSGIRTGGELVQEWLRQLQRQKLGEHNLPPLEDWATEKNLGIAGFTYAEAASFYPKVYDARFGDNPDDGYAFLEHEMKGKEPSIGYSILSLILEKTRHQVVITTNFDNLVADALATFTSTFPLVCGHESLSRFARPQLRRPLVAKIHRDLLYAPQNSAKGTSKLHRNWADALKRIFAHYTPIVIGYGGNDGSLMGFLNGLKPGTFAERIFWCYRRADGRPHQRILNLVAKHNGVIVPIAGFDEFMLGLNERMGYETQDKAIEDRAKERADEYRKNWEKVTESLKKARESAPPDSPDRQAAEEALGALTAASKRAKDSWWSWELKATQADDPDEKERIYREGLKRFPNSAELHCNFAIFIKNVRKDYDEAERLYRRALELDPDDADYTGNFAIFMTSVRKNHDEAERLYRRALELDPDDARITGNFANFMMVVRKDHDEAERLYRRALELNPDEATITGNFALFMTGVRKDHDEAERLFRRALELDPDSAPKTRNFSGFLLGHGRLDEAEQMARRAWELLNGDCSSHAVEVALYRGLILAATDRDDLPALGRLRTMLEAGFLRQTWLLDDELAATADRLSPEQRELYRAIADAIHDEEKVAALERLSQWQAVKPIPLDEPWP